ncbi:hypothetical protein E2562_012979 [Oryza meyeriana var. granulata]|uniref:Uncharacterized protein n=1 Tax=Oryza meyeriana var. granulata TaxID=110450 RepID=A0A6G1DHX3_9ORYZ|nr:hypothetical protein E2562_012979 [Oryza meyeriana var. granulata]
MSFPDDEDDEAFLLAVAATEEVALASSKRRRLSTSSSASSSPTPATPAAAVPEGTYLAALKGSHSSAWKQQQETLSQAHKRPGGSKTLAAPGSGSGGAQVARGGACFKCGDSSHWARAVSYTHLDVYKRQGEGVPLRRRELPSTHVQHPQEPGPQVLQVSHADPT